MKHFMPQGIIGNNSIVNQQLVELNSWCQHEKGQSKRALSEPLSSSGDGIPKVTPPEEQFQRLHTGEQEEGRRVDFIKKCRVLQQNKITTHKESEKCDPLAEEKKQAMEAAIESNQILDLVDKDFKTLEEQKTQDIQKTKCKKIDVNPTTQ